MNKEYKKILDEVINFNLQTATDKQMKRFNANMDKLKQLKEGKTE